MFRRAFVLVAYGLTSAATTLDLTQGVLESNCFHDAPSGLKHNEALTP